MTVASLMRAAVLGCIVVIGAVYSTPSAAQAVEPVVAFPGAEGAGRFATGGRGGEIVHVANLNASGPGSLAEAVSRPNRIVVFDVSGIIDLTETKKGQLRGGKIVIAQPNITIAGQTAPGEGVCLKGGCLDISAENVIVRYLRSRRGWIVEADTGDAIEVKPISLGEKTKAAGISDEKFDKTKAKKAERGKIIHEFAELSNIVIDHCSTSWATDENLTATHADRTTVSWCIAAEGCDYHNPKQTPPNHSEGSLWGSSAPDGRATMHHMLYAHNRLRNPRTTGGDDEPAVLNFYNSVVYNWSEYASHTGSERVLANWLHNFYRPGPDTPNDIRSTMFEFHGDPGARIHVRGNVIDGTPAATADNRLAVGHNQKFQKATAEERAAMIVATPFPDAPTTLHTAAEAFESVLADVGATLPARDAADLRIVESVRRGAGQILEKETDLSKAERWPDYRSLPPLADADSDGLPDFWERQFGLDPQAAGDGVKLARGYAQVEHYFNNTDPTGGKTPIVFVAATVSRVRSGQAGQWRVTRTGDTSSALTVRYTVRGDAESGVDFEPLADTVTLPAGTASATIAVTPLASARDGRTVVLSLVGPQSGCHVGCPAESLILIQKTARN